MIPVYYTDYFCSEHEIMYTASTRLKEHETMKRSNYLQNPRIESIKYSHAQRPKKITQTIKNVSRITNNLTSIFTQKRESNSILSDFGWEEIQYHGKRDLGFL